MKERNKAVPAVWLILMRKDGKILLGRRQNTGYRDGDYNLPAGHIEPGELPKDSMIREAKEEVGIKLNKEDLKFVHVSYRPKHDETGDRVDFFFLASKWKGEVTNAEPQKCNELKWVNPYKLPKNIPPHVKYMIRYALRGIVFSEFDKSFLKKHGLYVLEK